jgi:hypothetical protein
MNLWFIASPEFDSSFAYMAQMNRPYYCSLKKRPDLFPKRHGLFIFVTSKHQVMDENLQANDLKLLYGL